MGLDDSLITGTLADSGQPVIADLDRVTFLGAALPATPDPAARPGPSRR